MGKKKVIKKSQEELLKERESIESKIQKQEMKTGKGIKDKRAIIYIYSSYNNTILTLTDLNGNVLAWTSAGKIGFKGTKKGTPYAANRVAEVMVQVIQKLKIEEVIIKVKGIGGGRESAIRTLVAKGISLSSIEDITPIPHNGCKAPKPRKL